MIKITCPLPGKIDRYLPVTASPFDLFVIKR